MDKMKVAKSKMKPVVDTASSAFHAAAGMVGHLVDKGVEKLPAYRVSYKRKPEVQGAADSSTMPKKKNVDPSGRFSNGIGVGP